MRPDASDRQRPTAAALPRIRLATADDLPALLAIRNWALANTVACFTGAPETLAGWQERWGEKCATHPWLVAEIDGAVVGFALTCGLLGRCGIRTTVETSVYITAAHQKQGVATALYRRLIALLKAQGYTSVVAVITLPNPGSERLHGHFGFRHVGTLQRVGWKLGGWHDVTYWQLTLCAPTGAPRQVRCVAEVQSLMESDATGVAPGEPSSGGVLEGGGSVQ